MKKFFTLFILSLFSFSLFAYDGNRLSVSTVSNGMNLKIEIDGKRYNMQDNSITLSNIREGQHNVRIYREKKRNGNGIFNFGKKEEVIYASSVYLKRGFHTDITVNRFGKVFVDERRISSNDEWYDDEDYGYDDGYGNGYRSIMNAGDFNLVKQQISKEFHESSRLISVKTIIDRNNFSVQQVRELMQLFTFENNKLEVAKYAYRQTVDVNNFYQLADALTFSSSRDELSRFIREQGRR